MNDYHVKGLALNVPGIHFINGISFTCSQKPLDAELLVLIADAKDDERKLYSVLRGWFKSKEGR